MKTLKLTTVLLFISIWAQSQDTLKTPRKRHEIGVDLSSMLKYYFDLNRDYTLLTSDYFIQYRYNFYKNNNIRAGAGGYFIENKSPYINNTTQIYRKEQSLKYRLGIEQFQNLTSKFQVFYGLDFVGEETYEKDDGQYWNAGYASGNERKITGYGASALVGLRYRINKRLSLFTESSLKILSTDSWSISYTTPLVSNAPVLTNASKSKSKKTTTTFDFPLFIIIAVTI